MGDVRKSSKYERISSKSSFYKDISTKDGLNPICKTCRRVYYFEKFDKVKIYRKQYDKNRKVSDINFKIACNLRSRTSKAFKAQNSRKINKTFDFFGMFSFMFQKLGHSSTL